MIAIKKSLEKELQMFYSAVEQTADSVFITNKDGVIEYVNPAFEKMTGFSKEEALGNTPRIIKSGLQSREHYKKLWSTILDGKNFRTVVVNRRKDGKLFYADHTITPIKDNKGNVTHFVGIWKDITKQTQFEKRKEEFIATASHELKTPITVIKGYCQLLEKKLSQSKDKENLHFVTQISSQTDKVINLIRDFFDVSKIEAGKLVLSKQEFNLETLVKGIIENFKHSVGTHRIVLQGKVGRSLLGDPERIGQALINLLTNAIKYSPSGTKVLVNLTSKKQYALIKIEDFGIGISKPEQKKIFDRFYQANEGGREGFGLGLYITSEIVKKHGGKAWVESEKGKGSAFYITIPFQKS